MRDRVLLRRAWMAVAAVTAVAAAAAVFLLLRARPEREVCYSCFWSGRPAQFQSELIEMYSTFPCADDFCRAETAFLTGNLLPDESRVRDAVRLYESSLATERDPQRRLLTEMILGTAGARGGVNERRHLEAASVLAAREGRNGTSLVLAAMAANEESPRFGTSAIRTSLRAPRDAGVMVLGESTIVVSPGEAVGLQLERTYRDWLSYQFAFDLHPPRAGAERVLPYHEGARLRDVLRTTAVRPLPFAGTLLAERDGRWYAPDENGVFRFEVLADKVWYPTTKRRGRYALMTDTHGVSAIVEQSLASRAALVIGCGDTIGKMQAAYYLARRGVNVYMPCDRFIGTVLGHDAPGVILGTAPVKVVEGRTVIGHQPVAFTRGERIVVSDEAPGAGAQYNDAPARYFRALAPHFPMQARFVTVRDDSATAVTGEADRIGATAVALRVATPEQSAVLRRWLAASPDRRAVLFHSAPYPAGYRLFAEFPDQVTFGDPRPRFR